MDKFMMCMKLKFRLYRSGYRLEEINIVCNMFVQAPDTLEFLLSLIFNDINSESYELIYNIVNESELSLCRA